MSESPSAETEPVMPGRRAAFCVGAVLLAGLVTALAVAVRDNQRRGDLETIAETTAVGDSHYFPMPPLPTTPAFPVVAYFHGKPLCPADYRRHEAELDDMTRVGVEDKTGCVVYQAPAVAKDDDERRIGSILYLKVSATEFLKLREAGP